MPGFSAAGGDSAGGAVAAAASFWAGVVDMTWIVGSRLVGALVRNARSGRKIPHSTSILPLTSGAAMVPRQWISPDMSDR